MGTSLSSPRPPCSSTQNKPFRFLDLPADLRYMVYEEIEISTCHYRLEDPTFYSDSSEEATPSSYMTLVVKSLLLALLATCRLIHHEAAPYLAHKLETLRNEPSHFTIDSTSLYSLVNSYNSIGTMLEKHEYDNSTRKWYGAGAGKDPKTWIPRWIDIRGRFPRRTHVFMHGSRKHTAIVAFYRKCLETRRRRFTTKTVITGLGIDPLWQVKEISDAEWKIVSSRDGTVNVSGEGVP
ncbi:hypothetical protein BKA58DRAFT_388209 [Alternaria rosae]|uniref:uncharacterized protein n=1 Tax=Alternaria rosae TaxID=1187941 RepID=UPI001E8DDA17|nr:uncharacterized protein BKA58DRAFT_388209 [Alternaria rosae]KAH6866555.1 hypothetical protein BKA58DRAFT_388209 [Alternaria rosae]